MALPDDPRNITLKLILRDINSLDGFYFNNTLGQYQLSRK